MPHASPHKPSAALAPRPGLGQPFLQAAARPSPLLPLLLALLSAALLPRGAWASFSCYSCTSCGFTYCNNCRSTSFSGSTCSGNNVVYQCAACNSCTGGTCIGCNSFDCSGDVRWNAALVLGLILGIGVPCALLLGIGIWYCMRARRAAAASATYTTHTAGGGYELTPQPGAYPAGYYAPPPGNYGTYGGAPPNAAYTPSAVPAYGVPVTGYPAGAGADSCPPGYGQQPYGGYPPQYGGQYGGQYGAAAGQPVAGLGAPPPGYPSPAPR